MTLPQSGIYKITNLRGGKVYVGQSQNVWQRRKQHWTALKGGHHDNREMQADWDKCCGRSFRFDVIEFCPLEKLNEREKYWIDKLNTIESGYNCGWSPFKRHAPKIRPRKVVGYRKRS